MKAEYGEFIKYAMEEFTGPDSSPSRAFCACNNYPSTPYVAIKNKDLIVFFDADTLKVFATRPYVVCCKTCGQEIHAPR
jgi:hypothetical protein